MNAVEILGGKDTITRILREKSGDPNLDLSQMTRQEALDVVSEIAFLYTESKGFAEVFNVLPCVIERWETENLVQPGLGIISIVLDAFGQLCITRPAMSAEEFQTIQRLRQKYGQPPMRQ